MMSDGLGGIVFLIKKNIVMLMIKVFAVTKVLDIYFFLSPKFIRWVAREDEAWDGGRVGEGGWLPRLSISAFVWWGCDCDGVKTKSTPSLFFTKNLDWSLTKEEEKRHL